MSSPSEPPRPPGANTISRFFQRKAGEAGTKRRRTVETPSSVPSAFSLHADNSRNTGHPPIEGAVLPAPRRSDAKIQEVASAKTSSSVEVAEEKSSKPFVIEIDLEEDQPAPEDASVKDCSTTKAPSSSFDDVVARTVDAGQSGASRHDCPFNIDNGDNGVLDQKTLPSSPPGTKENPFAKFAFSKSTVSTGDASSGDQRRNDTTSSSARTWQKLRPSGRPGAPASVENSVRPRSGKDATHAKKAPTEPPPAPFVRMRDLPPEEQLRIVRKWHSLAEDAQAAPLEVRRFQVLLAARLHARCQEPTVRRAMAALRANFPDGLTVEAIAGADPEVLASCISNLQYYNAKANQVVKAAQEIRLLFGGTVPEDELSLLRITGIGKVFADLLAFVNTREAFDSGGGSAGT